MSAFFITSTGTGIGKTLVTTSLCHQLTQVGKKVRAIKPVISGWEAGSMENDTMQILQSLDLPINEKTISHTSPWRFIQPLSPDMAATKEGRTIPFHELVSFCKEAIEEPVDYTLIEGVGGVAVPLDEKYTILDLIKQLGIPVVVVVGSYLGTLSHTLTTLKLLEHEKIRVQAVIISETEDSTVSLEDTQRTLSTHTNHTMVLLPRIQKATALWSYVADITAIL